MNRHRSALVAALAAMVAIAILFYTRQNAGLQPGGGISLPKMLWLTYAVTTWLVIPLFLWRDTGLAMGLRHLFKWFWIAMAARAAVELILIYAFGHWNPWYGISHDLFCILLLIVLRRGLPVVQDRDRYARGFAFTLIVALCAETVFAAIFLQTGAAADGIYFASSDTSWGFVNLLTIVVLGYVLPDFVLMLARLYFPGTGGKRRKAVDGIRVCAGSAIVLITCAALGFWLWMDNYEKRTKRFQNIGYEIAEVCNRFSAAFYSGDTAAVDAFVLRGNVAWGRENVVHEHLFAKARWTSKGERRPLRQALHDWRQSFTNLKECVFKIHLIDEIHSDTDLTLQLRFELVGQRGSDSGLLRCRMLKHESGHWQISETQLIEGVSVTAPGPLFEERGSASGIDFVLAEDRRFAPGRTCTEHECSGPTQLKFQTMRYAYAGASAADIDNDGLDDVFFCSGDRAALYRNLGGRFEDVTEAAGLKDLFHVNTAGFADFDNDGDLDLFLGSFYGSNRLMENDGSGNFTPVDGNRELLQVDMVTCFTVFDYDNDGDLDLYLGRFLDAAREIPDSFLYARNGQPNRLYRNDGGFQFTDVTHQAGVGDHGLTLSLAAADYDMDGDQDLYVANDFGRNELYDNQGDGTFQPVAREKGAMAVGGSMSASWGDFDNDGRLDLYVAAIRSNNRWFAQPQTLRRVMFKFIREGKIGPDNPVFSDIQEYMGSDWINVGNFALAGNYLLRQNADTSFTDTAESASARPAGWYWSSGFFDIDHDGDLDILATNGWITGENAHDLCEEFNQTALSTKFPYQSGYLFSDKFISNDSWNGHERNRLLINMGEGKFTEAATAYGVDSIRDARGLAVADFDQDGDLDFVISNYRSPAQYFVNNAARGHWLQIRLRGRDSNRYGVGAIIHLAAGGVQCMRVATAGDGYASQFSQTIHVGLGAATVANRIDVIWPSGRRQTLRDVGVDRRLEIVEPEGPLETTVTRWSAAAKTAAPKSSTE